MTFLATIASVVAIGAGVNSIYHNNGIQTWLVRPDGESENVEVG